MWPADNQLLHAANYDSISDGEEEIKHNILKLVLNEKIEKL
jgi:hypothetical protein